MLIKIILSLIFIILLTLVITCCLPKFKGFRHDAPLEELFEDMIENYTGVDIDFTPGTIEV
jgi:hypothetical protein